MLAPPPKLLERVRQAIRLRHYSLRTEHSYVQWIRLFILFHGRRHPSELGASEVSDFLSDLAVWREVAASTQNQAKAALPFLYRQVLEQELPWLDAIVQANGQSSCSRLNPRDGMMPPMLARLSLMRCAGYRGADPLTNSQSKLRTMIVRSRSM